MAKATSIRRGYTGEAGSQVHYRVAGSGPPLVLFHQSPRSAVDYLPLIAEWAADFTVIAPDTPGYGASDPLPAPPGEQRALEMPDFAAAMAEFLDNIAIERAAFYGFHTGASLAVALAAQAPARVAAVVANGLALLDADERSDILEHYLPAFEPVWDGSHLAWLWARMREQVIFFPWYDRRNQTRLFHAMRAPQQIDAQILDILLAGDAYAAAYRAAFNFDKSALARVKSPLLVMATPTDPLAGHLQRLGDLPAGVSIHRPGGPGAALDRARAFLVAAELPAAPAIAAALPGGPGGSGGPGPWRDYSDAAGAQIHFQRAGEAKNDLVILLHDLCSGSRVLEDEIAWLAPRYNVVAPDLPGHGQSDDLPPDQAATPEAYADMLLEAVSGLSSAPVKIIAFGLSAAVGLALARRLGDRVSRLVLADSGFPTPAYEKEYSARYLPDLTANAHGGHLLAGWRFARSASLFWPWFREDIPGIRPIDGAIQPRKIQQRFVALWAYRGTGAGTGAGPGAGKGEAGQGGFSPLFFTAPTARQMRGLPVSWVYGDWADAMAGMEKPWAANNGKAFSYAGADGTARRAALSEALSMA